jgi:hypothetical protein
MRAPKRPFYDIEFPQSLRAVVIPFLEGLVEEVKRERAADPELRGRPHEYVLWAEPTLERLRAAEGDYAPLDEMDMETLRKDVLPSLMARQIRQFGDMIEINTDKEELFAQLDEMQAANQLIKRLDKAVTFDMFDGSFRGDRAEVPEATPALTD